MCGIHSSVQLAQPAAIKLYAYTVFHLRVRCLGLSRHRLGSVSRHSLKPLAGTSSGSGRSSMASARIDPDYRANVGICLFRKGLVWVGKYVLSLHIYSHLCQVVHHAQQTVSSCCCFFAGVYIHRATRQGGRCHRSAATCCLRFVSSHHTAQLKHVQGGIDAGETPATAAKRELEEETGVVSASIVAEVTGLARSA